MVNNFKVSHGAEYVNQETGEVVSLDEVNRGNKMISQRSMQGNSSLVSVEQSRAVAEVQAQMVMAKQFPRDEDFATAKILKVCQNYSFADSAFYSYPRGKDNIVKGMNIDAARMVSGYWGNILYGFDEVARGEDYSEVIAYAWDLETNMRVKRQLRIGHYRKSGQQNTRLYSERDIYEHVASFAQRRVRACVFEVIPYHIKQQVEETLIRTIKNGQRGELPTERIDKMIGSFQKFGVTKEMLEAYLDHEIEKTGEDEIVTMIGIHNAIRDKERNAQEIFDFSLQNKKGKKDEKGKQKQEEQERQTDARFFESDDEDETGTSNEVPGNSNPPSKSKGRTEKEPEVKKEEKEPETPADNDVPEELRYEKWKDKKTAGFMDFINENLDAILDFCPQNDIEKMVVKWEKLYPGKQCPLIKKDSEQLSLI